MSIKKFVFPVLFCILCLSRTASIAQKADYEVSVFQKYRSLPVNKSAADKFTKIISKSFPGWVVTTDKLNGNFTDAYGSPIHIDGVNNVARAGNCMKERMGKLNVNAAEWKKLSDPSARKADYVNYKQVINSHEVVFSRLSFRFTKSGELMRIQMKNYGAPKNISPTLGKTDARQIALTGLDNEHITEAKINDAWAWFPIPTTTGYELHPAWPFEVTGKGKNGMPLILTGYIDATNGAMLYRSNKVKEASYDLTVKGNVYKDGTLHPATLEPLPYINLQIGVSTYTADVSGLFTSTGILLPQSTKIPLAGSWSKVYDYPTTTTPTFTDLVTTPGTIYTYPTTSLSSDRHVNAYYHVTRIHDFMKGYFPLFTGLDFALPTYVDVAGSCNAFYGGRQISFYAEDAQCYSFAELGDVIYHEYGHGISDLFYTDITGSSIMNGALNEACSDIWALSITHNPILAENAYKGYGGFIRRYDQIPQVYPLDLDAAMGEVHKVGQIIAGSWWDVAVNIGSVDTMTKLFTDVYFDAPDGPWGTEGDIYQGILIDALMADDNNANLSDGTPHYAQIVAAFVKHGIYLERDATLVHDDMPVQQAGIPIIIKLPPPYMTATYFHDMTLQYRVNDTGVWHVVSMADTSMHFTGVIPAQAAGTTISYYFTMHDALNTVNGYFPANYNPTLPAEQSSIPYQFVTGVKTVDSINFESATTGWKIGHNTGDDAINGIWEVRTPSSTVFGPISDHSGMGRCLTSGNGVMDTGVRDGTTSVLSPVFDISHFKKPVVEYYRWFSNDQGWWNFKNDPWVVKIRDASGTTWKTVERTYQGDDAWKRRVFPVSSFLPASTKSIQLQFFASDSILSNWAYAGQSTTVAAMDDFSIYDIIGSTAVDDVAQPLANIYPNPADEKVRMDLPTGSAGKASLYDMMGKKVVEININTGSTSYAIDTRRLSAGSYNLLLQTNYSVQSKKIAVVHN